MKESDTEKISKMMKIVEEIASSVTEVSSKADPDMATQLKAAARTLIDHANKNSDDVDELYKYLRNARDYPPGQHVDDAASRLGAKTLRQRWNELEEIYHDP